MRIFITGASGFIGSHLLQSLLNAGHEVIAGVHNSKTIEQRWPSVKTIECDFTKDHAITDWLPCLKNIDVVINAVGIICETRQQRFDALHTQAPCALFKACEQAGVKRVIQISALGADESAFSRYHLSKRAADNYLMQLKLNWTIVMPSIVYGPGAKSMALFKALAALPLIPIIGKGDQAVQPIHVNDLTRAVMQLVQSDKLKPSCIEMVGPQPVNMKTIYTSLHHWLGLGTAKFISMPYPLALLAGQLGGLLGNTPLTAEAIEMLRKGNTGDVKPFIEKFGFEPADFKQALARTPAQQSDRWHAGLYFLKPILRFTIAFLWIVSGIVSAFVFPVEQSYDMLAQAGITGIWAPLMLYSAAAVDFILGIATLLAYRINLVGMVQIALIVIYSVIISFALPEQWIHPFGPVTKNLPLVAATLIMMVLERR